jgi:SAM-dependent methyltransferase
MEKFKYLQKVKDIYSKGKNIIQFLKSIDQKELNTIEDILISYDFQSGSYVRGYSQKPDFKNAYCGHLADVINNLGEFDSLLEVGVGEATTIGVLARKLGQKPRDLFGFDISWSRLKFGKAFLNDIGVEGVNLFAANLFEIPLPDNSVDVVYTSHSIEPNGGKEEEALKELFRITGKYLVLLEPCYELAGEEARTRMKHHGYITRLQESTEKLGYKVIEFRLFDLSSNSLNPTGLTIIQKEPKNRNQPELICPITHTPLNEQSDSFLYSRESFLAYPVLEGIPCLLKDNAILAIHLLTSYEKFKKENNIHF